MTEPVPHQPDRARKIAGTAADGDDRPPLSEGRRLLHRAAATAEPLPPLLLEAIRIAETVRQGLHGRRRAGSGETFWQFRDFEQHDSSQRIDWRQSSKGDRLFVRDREWEAAQTVYLWADRSPSMVFRSTRQLSTKRHRAMLLLLATASLLIRHDERVALVSRRDRIPPVSGRYGLIRLADALVPPEADAADMLEAAAHYNSLPPVQPLPRHAQSVWFGDFLSPLPEIAAAIEPLANAGIRGHLVQILDPAEENLPYKGHARFRDLEDGQRLLIPRVETVRPLYEERLAAHRDGLAALAHDAGWSLTGHRTDQSPASCLLTLYSRLGRPEGLPR